MVTTVNRYRKSVRTLLKHAHSRGTCPPPIPRNKADGGRKILLIHQVQGLAKLQEAIARLEERVVNNQAGAGLGAVPADVAAGPLEVHCGGNSAGEKVLYVEILCDWTRKVNGIATCIQVKTHSAVDDSTKGDSLIGGDYALESVTWMAQIKGEVAFV